MILDNKQTSLGSRVLPARMCDPDTLPAMCGTIQKACTCFPQAAANIIGENHLAVEEFNSLNDKVKKNPFFRFQVQRQLDKLKSQA
jgi:hypothetical protein